MDDSFVIYIDVGGYVAFVCRNGLASRVSFLFHVFFFVFVPPAEEDNFFFFNFINPKESERFLP